MSKTLCRIAFVAVTVVLLTGCVSPTANNCPAVSSLVETSIARVFKSGAPPDPSTELYTVEVVGVHSSCDVDKDAANSTSSLDVTFRATRAPNGGTVRYKVPYFVSVSHEDQILAKKSYYADFQFEEGQTSVDFTDSVDSIAVNAARDKKTYDYVILVGLQLTRAQLDYNRSTGHLSP